MGTANNDENLLPLDRIQSFIDACHQKKFTRISARTQLISHAKASGFINNLCRKSAWTLLIDPPTDGDYSADQQQIESHQYYEQVRMDVIRTLKRFPPNYSDLERNQLQDQLIVMIVKILIHHGELHYYQGYHDICLTFLLVLGEDECLPVIDSITMSHLKYFMEPTMVKTRDSLSYLMPLINCINSECAEYMERGDIGHVIFALPWFITWYSHVLDNLDIILRLYDLFLVSHFLMPIYVAAQIVDYYADQVLLLDCDMASLHQYLSSLPCELNEQSWEEIIQRALYLFETHPPETLDDLNLQWKMKCEHIEKYPTPSTRRRRPSVKKSSNSSGNDRHRTSIFHSSPSSLAFWGFTLAVGGLAIYLWNQVQQMDPTQSLSLGDFLQQFYQ